MQLDDEGACVTLVHVPFRELPRPSLRAHGDQWDWGSLVPSAWQALADPDGMHPWPAMSISSGPDDVPLQAWFTPAVHLLAYSLAWPSLGLGASRWVHLAQPSEDPRLSLIDEMLGDRRNELAAWLMTSEWPKQIADGAADAAGAPPHEPDLAVDQEWLDALESDHQARSAGWGPFGGGTDPMHLAAHSLAPAADTREGDAWLKADPSDRRAVLVVKQYAGWYGALGRLGSTLPPRADGRSWRVDVLCRPVGWLGTYRRSRKTGRWFAGRHSVHTLGWAED